MISTYREVERYLSKSWKPLHGRPILELRERTSGGEGLSKSQWLVRFTLNSRCDCCNAPERAKCANDRRWHLQNWVGRFA